MADVNSAGFEELAMPTGPMNGVCLGVITAEGAYDVSNYWLLTPAG